jgi:hypothetical protein
VALPRDRQRAVVPPVRLAPVLTVEVCQLTREVLERVLHRLARLRNKHPRVI